MKSTSYMVVALLAFAALCMLFVSKHSVVASSTTMIRGKREASVLNEVEARFGKKPGKQVASKSQVTSAKSIPKTSESTGEWKCCVDTYSVNDIHNHPTAEAAQDEHHNYACPEKPSNFSWYYSTPSHPAPLAFDRSKWKKTSIVFVGGSTTRQMYEQYKWEMPKALNRSHHNYGARFLFEHIEVGGCCNYDRSHVLDTRKLHPELVASLRSAPDFLVFNVATWWGTATIGTVIDKNGVPWSIGGTPVETEWIVANKTSDKPDFSFATTMGRAIKLMQEMKHPKTTLVWRSEGTTDCPVGTNFRASIAPVLQKMDVPVLNVSQASCDYLDLRDNYDREHKGPHLCFPSVGLRHWLLQFQRQFL